MLLWSFLIRQCPGHGSMGLLLPGHVALGQLRAVIRHQAVLSWKTNVFPGTTPTPRSRAATSLLGMPGSSRQRRIICLRNHLHWEFQRWVRSLLHSDHLLWEANTCREYSRL